MISPEHCHVFRIPQFVREEQSDHFHIVWISIYVVTLEEILFVRWWPYLIEKTKQIPELTMCVTCDDDGCFNIDYYSLLFKLGNE